MHSDPIADMLTRIRNACHAKSDRVLVTWSRMKVALAGILKQEGFVDDFRELVGAKAAGQGRIEIRLRYDDKGDCIISGIKRLSTPGSRRYFGYADIPRVRSGLGVMVLTTSKGLMSDREARRSRVGGEALFEVW